MVPQLVQTWAHGFYLNVQAQMLGQGIGLIEISPVLSGSLRLVGMRQYRTGIVQIKIRVPCDWDPMNVK